MRDEHFLEFEIGRVALVYFVVILEKLPVPRRTRHGPVPSAFYPGVESPVGLGRVDLDPSRQAWFFLHAVAVLRRNTPQVKTAGGGVRFPGDGRGGDKKNKK